MLVHVVASNFQQSTVNPDVRACAKSLSARVLVVALVALIMACAWRPALAQLTPPRGQAKPAARDESQAETRQPQQPATGNTFDPFYGAGTRAAETPNEATLAFPHKAAGVIRVGIMTTNAPNSLQALAVREKFLIMFHQDGIIESVALESQLEKLAVAEAARKECDYVLFTDITELKASKGESGGGFSRFKALASVASKAMQAGDSIASAVSNTRGYPRTTGAQVGAARVVDAAESLSQALDSLGKLTKKKDELSLGYRLLGTTSAALYENKKSRQAAADGEDLLGKLLVDAGNDLISILLK